MLRFHVLLPLLLALAAGGGLAGLFSPLGSIMDPNGRPTMTTMDRGSGMDPDGRPATTTADLGSGMDPNG